MKLVQVYIFLDHTLSKIKKRSQHPIRPKYPSNFPNQFPSLRLLPDVLVHQNVEGV